MNIEKLLAEYKKDPYMQVALRYALEQWHDIEVLKIVIRAILAMTALAVYALTH